MNALEDDLLSQTPEVKRKPKTKKKKEEKAKKSKICAKNAKEKGKGKSPKAPKTPDQIAPSNTPLTSEAGRNSGPTAKQAFVPRNKDEREERDYLRGQSLLDLDMENKRASSAFDLAERANRMA